MSRPSGKSRVTTKKPAELKTQPKPGQRRYIAGDTQYWCGAHRRWEKA